MRREQLQRSVNRQIHVGHRNRRDDIEAGRLSGFAANDGGDT